jgi:hypothetical protein
MHVLDPNPEASSCLGNGLHLYCLMGVHTANRLIVCSLICNRDIAYDENIKLDFCDVISTTSEIGMAIITLGRLYFVLSWRPAPASDLAPRPG